MTHRFYADENFPLQTVQAMRQLGHDVLTVKDSGHAGKAVTDLEILALKLSELVIQLERRLPHLLFWRSLT